jgi:iron complex transport system permease protein
MKIPAVILFLLALLACLVMASLVMGRYPISWSDAWAFFRQSAFGGSWLEPRQYQLLKNIFFDIRLPRIAAAVLIGASLSVSGASYQSMFINPLVSPGILGVLAGASFGAAMGMIAFDSWTAVQATAVLCGLAAVGGAVGMAALYRGDRLLMLILGGIISGALFTSLLSMVKYVADPYDELPAIVYWLMGSLSMSGSGTLRVVALPMLAGIGILFVFSGYLNILSMGDEEARSLGVNVRWIRCVFIFVSTLISCLTVAMGGIIGWVGLVVPHMARMIVGPDNRILLPTAALMGAAYLLVVDDISRLVLSVEIPIGILTSLVGIPFFAIILRNARKGWR